MVENPLEKAIAVIKERGWYQGYYYDQEGDGGGGVCILGAIGVACAGNPEAWWNPSVGNELEPLAALVRDELGLDAGYVLLHDWNDDPGRTEEDVILALKKAAVAWDGTRATTDGQEVDGDA